MQGRGARSDEAVRREAADWAALIHDPDAAVDRAGFERWRAADPHHAEAYARVERGWEQSALLAQSSFGRTRHLPERRRLLPGSPPRLALATAATLVVAVVGLAIGAPGVLQRFTRPNATEMASQVGQIRKIGLADGSRVTLDTDSLVRVAFTPNERRLYLSRGRARFDVAHDAGRPFVVMAGTGSIVARGTVFDVSIADGRVKVTLLRGVVDVRNRDMRPGAGSARAAEQLRPGEKLAFVASAPLPSPQPAVDTDQQWTTGMLTFGGTRLADVIAEANRYSTAKIAIADPALGDLRITGAYHATDTSGLAQSVAGSLGLRVARTRGGGFILSRPDGDPTV